MYTHPTSFHDQNTQIKILQTRSQNSSTPKLGLHWLLESLGVQSSPSSRAASNSWSFSSRWWLDRWKKCEGPSLLPKKNINPKMIGTLHFNSFIKKPTTWQIFFFQASPNRNHHIPSHQPHPINGVMPSCVFCHASGMTIMITSTSYPIYISCFKTAFLPQFYNGVPPKWSPKNVMCSFLTHFWSPKKNSDNFPL